MQFISNNILPISMAVFSGIMLLWSFFGNRFRGIKEVNSAGALQLINHKDAVVLDVREQSEYDSGHVLNAKLLPLGKLKERIGELEKYKDQSHRGGLPERQSFRYGLLHIGQARVQPGL